MHVLALSPDQAVLCCICVGSLISAGICCLVGGPVSERSRGYRLIETAGLPTGSPPSSASSSFPLIQPLGSAASVHWSASDSSASCWVFWRAVMLGPFFVSAP